MGRALYLPEAREDLFTIWQYVFEQTQSLGIADSVVERIDERAKTYATQPEMGELRPDLAPDVRCFPSDYYVVFYLPMADGIEIIQIIHGSRDVPLHFRRPQRPE